MSTIYEKVTLCLFLSGLRRFPGGDNHYMLPVPWKATLLQPLVPCLLSEVLQLEALSQGPIA